MSDRSLKNKIVLFNILGKSNNTLAFFTFGKPFFKPFYIIGKLLLKMFLNNAQQIIDTFACFRRDMIINPGPVTFRLNQAGRFQDH